MGSCVSVDLSQHENICNNYFSIQMGSNDRFRLILAPENIIQATQSVILKSFAIQDIETSPGFVEFKLSGRPWYSNDEENLNVKIFMCALMQKYYEFGWSLKAASDLHRSGNDTNVLFFHKELPILTSVICLSLNSSDRIRTLGPVNIYPLIKQAVLRTWSQGIQNEAMFGESYEIKLYGNPWTDKGHDSTDAFDSPTLICEIMNILFKNGWHFISAINTGKNHGSLNALYFRYEPEQINIQELNNTNFFAVSLNKSDRIRFLRASNELISILSNEFYGMSNIWKAGIQHQVMVNNALEYKLQGNPWNSSGDEAVESRRLFNQLFNLLSRYGYNLYATCDLTKSLSNKSTFFFRSKPIEPKTLVNFCLSLNQIDKIRLIDYDFNLNIIDQVRLAINQSWPFGILEEKDYYNSWQLKLKGTPFQASSSDHIYACVMMIFILNSIEKRGFRLLCSADVSGKYHSSQNGGSYPIDLHSWFFEN